MLGGAVTARDLWVAVATVLVGTAAIDAFLPVWFASNRYTVAKADNDYERMCQARSQVVDAWASAGIASQANEWRVGGAIECLQAAQARQREMNLP